jgi:exopolysaccharide biosynthesis predicted pyruvyltransferase EpsI
MSDVVPAQRTALDTLYRRHLTLGSRYALLDFPDHANVGDSAIWLGELVMLRGITGRDPDYVCTWHDFDEQALRTACPDGIVFLHGGGNLGDIWPHHQQMRETVLERLRDRTVVQLPQSIHFRDASAAARFAGIAARHPQLTLYARDTASLAIAQQMVGTVAALAPDSAFALGGQARREPDVPVLALMRTDKERVDSTPALPAGTFVCDWLEDDDGLSGDHAALATARVARGLRLLSRGQTIATDRPHGHILALLLDIPHIVFDNDYGKIGRYVATWTRDSPRLLRALPSPPRSVAA